MGFHKVRSQAIVVLALLSAVGLTASSCSDNDNESVTADTSTSEEDDIPATSGTSIPPVTTRPALTTSSTTLATTTTTLDTTTLDTATLDTDTSEDSDAVVDNDTVDNDTADNGTADKGTGRPPAPANLECLAGTSAGELLVEWDAPEDTTNISKVRLYVSVDGGPFITNSTIPLSQVDTTRPNNKRWAAPVSGLPTGEPLRLAVTTFNALRQESGWNPLKAHYIGPGEACGSGVSTISATTTTLSATTTTLSATTTTIPATTTTIPATTTTIPATTTTLLPTTCTAGC